jgi:hypothetical protein
MKHKFRKLFRFELSLTIVAFVILSCSSVTYHFRSNYRESNRLMHDSKNLQTKQFLKTHLKNGDVCILKDTWQVDTVKNLVIGTGIRYDFNRLKKTEGVLFISLDSVAIFETNGKLLNPGDDRIAALCLWLVWM